MQTKILFILIIGIAFTSSAKAQEIDTVAYYMKGAGFSEHIVNNIDSADFYRLILPPDTNTDENLFVVNDFYKDGKSKMVGKSRGQRFMELSGACVRYFPNGRRESIENYDHGKLKGYVVKYYPNGKPYLTGMYNDSSRLIVDECKDSTGKVFAQNGIGHYVIYDKAFKQIQSEGEIINGRENGEWHGTLGDTIRYTCTYVNGVVKNGISHSLNGKDYIFFKAEAEPTYKGGIVNFYGFLAHTIRYPADAKEKNIQGKVILTFVVNKDGTLSDIRVIRGIGGGCDQESLRVLNMSPKWQPGKLYGVPVQVQYTMPISFTLVYENR